MTRSRRIDSASTVPGRPILRSGQPVPALHETFVAECRRRDASADTGLFAEPVMGQQSGQIDWYTDEPGTCVPWPEIPEDQRGPVRESLRASVEGIRALRDRTGSRFDQLVDAALEIPDESDIVVAGGRPVLVRWGMMRDGPVRSEPVIDRVLAQGATSTAARTPSVSPAAPVAPRQGPQHIAPPRDGHHRALGDAASTLFLSLALTALALTISGLLVLQNCGIALPKFLTGGRVVTIASFCPVTSAAYDPNSELLALLEREVRDRALECVPTAGVDGTPRAEAATETPPPVMPAGPEDPAEDPSPEVPEVPSEEPVPEDPVPDAPPETEVRQREEDRGVQTGRLSITLAWDGTADLDLQVICPGGGRIYFGNKQACGGELQIDANNWANKTPMPLENVYWPEDEAPEGTFRVHVSCYGPVGDCNAGVTYTVIVRSEGGDVIADFAGTATERADKSETEPDSPTLIGTFHLQ